MVAENARQSLEQLRVKQFSEPEATAAALEELSDALYLAQAPRRVECYDISDIHGTLAVGSMVVFEEGKPKPSHYRRFRIKTVSGANDYAMLQEVLERRFKQVKNNNGKSSQTWKILPDLILIDGGKGQLNSAMEVLEKTGLQIPMIGLAKENEEIFLPGKKNPVILPKTSPGLQLLQQLRDEAHRFAISYFTRLHKRKTFTSALDSIPGIGPRRKSALIRQFGSVPRIREATVEELVAATGMTRNQAEKIKEYL